MFLSERLGRERPVCSFMELACHCVSDFCCRTFFPPFGNQTLIFATKSLSNPPPTHILTCLHLSIAVVASQGGALHDTFGSFPQCLRRTSVAAQGLFELPLNLSRILWMFVVEPRRRGLPSLRSPKSPRKGLRFLTAAPRASTRTEPGRKK